MDDLTVCRLSAEALEKRVREDIDPEDIHFMRLERYDGDLNGGEWNPFIDAEQRWECVEWLRQRKCHLLISPGHHHKVNLAGGETISIYDHDAARVPARAVAELRRREEKT